MVEDNKEMEDITTTTTTIKKEDSQKTETDPNQEVEIITIQTITETILPPKIIKVIIIPINKATLITNLIEMIITKAFKITIIEIEALVEIIIIKIKVIIKVPVTETTILKVIIIKVKEVEAKED